MFKAFERARRSFSLAPARDDQGSEASDLRSAAVFASDGRSGDGDMKCFLRDPADLGSVQDGFEQLRCKAA